ncbi:hypothetical protein ACFWR9_39895 [Streptomyces sp. NPDC058534]
MSREVAPDELVARPIHTVRPECRAHFIGELSHTQVHDVLEGF